MYKKFMSLIIAFVCLFCSVGCSNSSTPANSDSTNQNVIEKPKEEPEVKKPENKGESFKPVTASVDEAKKNIAVEVKPIKSGGHCVFITNNNDFTLGELEIQLIYLDESDNIVDVGEDGHDVILPGKTVVSKMSDPKNYSKVETKVDIDLEANERYKNHLNNVESSINEGDDCIITKITNKSDVLIEEVEIVVVLYLNNEITYVSYPKDIRDIPAGKTVIEKVDIQRKKYDRYELYINQAHTFRNN